MFSKKLKEGPYRAALLLNPQRNTELPFNFIVSYKGKKPIITIKNADEKIIVDEVIIKGDSVNFKMPVFDTEFKTVLKGDSLSGIWINHYRKEKNIIPFRAVYGEYKRFLFVPGKANPVFEGKWEVTFSPGSKDSSKAIGIFHHQEGTDYVTGTFLTETGDYRYLEGMKRDNALYLSCFDGSHAYLFIATIQKNNVYGVFYSGAHWEESWFGSRNDAFTLRDANKITFLKNPDEKLNFTFPDLNKNPVSLNDKRFKNKPLIIQVMGSWCPNCMDESRYLSEVYRTYKDQGLEIIALAFEKTTDFGKSKSLLTRLKERLKIDYTILITPGKDKKEEVLTELNKISAFPTTIFLNRDHKVVNVHTGFNGPATGNEYELFKKDTENLIVNLLKG
jgi:thiol-disulfide isomerase/thioredoxin